MRWKATIALCILASIAVSILYLIRLKQGKLPSSPGSPQPEETSRLAPELPPFHLKDHPALAPLTAKVASAEVSKTANESLARIRPDLESLSAEWRLMERVEFQGKDLLEEGLRLMRRRKYREARDAFQLFINTYGESSLVPSVSWAIGLAFYEEGGNENLLKAIAHFKTFLSFELNDQEGLEEAAQLDIAVIYIQLLSITTEQDSRIVFAAQAENALRTFLARWPTSSYASAARIQLKELEDRLSRSR